MAPNEEHDHLQEWWHSLDVSDPKAWQRLLRLMLPAAMRALQEGFGLIQLHGGDELAAEAALWSAWSSFQRHYLEGDIEDLRDQEALAGHFSSASPTTAGNEPTGRSKG